MTTDLDVAVVGAGMAGLTAAHELRRAGREVRVFEAQDAVGGRMRTVRRDGYLIDTGAEQISVRGYRATWELARRCGITPDAVHRSGRPMAAWRAGRVHRGVGDPVAVVTGAGLGPAARLSLARFLARASRHRAAFGHDRPERTPLGGATVADLARHYHPELLERMLDPVARAFFGWDPARSAAAPLVALLLSVGPISSWRAYPGGMDLLARRLADGLDVVTGQAVEEVADDGATARLTVGGRTLTARAVILAVPAPAARRLHANPAADEAGYLTASTYRPMLKVTCALDRPLAPDPRAYALLTPACEESTLAGIIADHLRCPDRAPAGRGLLGLMAAPQRIPELLETTTQEAVHRLTAAAERYVPGLRAACADHLLTHWPEAMPELTPRALAERSAFLARPARSVEYAGDWVAARPSSEGAVRSGALAASRVLSRRAAAPAPASAQEVV